MEFCKSKSGHSVQGLENQIEHWKYGLVNKTSGKKRQASVQGELLKNRCIVFKTRYDL